MSKLEKKTDYFRFNAECYLAAPIKANGELATEDDIYLDCHFKGKIIASGMVEIAKNAVFNGTIQARACIISGQISGQITTTEEVIIEKSAIIDADIDAFEVEIERGANIRGRITMKAVA